MNDYEYYKRRAIGNQYGLALYTGGGPAVEPVSTSDMKTHLRVDTSDDDTYIGTLVTAARTHVENILGKRLITQTWVLTRDEFPIGDREILMPYGPVQSISALTYVDTSGTTTTLSAANYVLDTASIVARVYPAFSLIWPSTRNQRNAVSIRYVTGYGAAASSIPANIVHAVKLLVGHWYENRESVVIGATVANLPQAIDTLLHAERVSWL